MQLLTRHIVSRTSAKIPLHHFSSNRMNHSKNLHKGYHDKLDTSSSAFKNLFECRDAIERDLDDLRKSFNFGLMVRVLEKSKEATTRWKDRLGVTKLNEYLCSLGPCLDGINSTANLDTDLEVLYKICLYSLNLKLSPDFTHRAISEFIKLNTDPEKASNIFETLANIYGSSPEILEKFYNLLHTVYAKHGFNSKLVVQTYGINCIYNLFIINSQFDLYKDVKDVVFLLSLMINHKDTKSPRIEKILSVLKALAHYAPYNDEFHSLLERLFEKFKMIVNSKTSRLSRLLHLSYYEIIFSNKVSDESNFYAYLDSLLSETVSETIEIASMPHFFKYIYSFFKLNGLIATRYNVKETEILDTIFEKKSRQVHREIKSSFQESTLYGISSRSYMDKDGIEALLRQLGIAYRQEMVFDSFLVDIAMMNFREFLERCESELSKAERTKIKNLTSKPSLNFLIEIDGNMHFDSCLHQVNYKTRFKRSLLSKNNVVINMSHYDCINIIKSSAPADTLKHYLIKKITSI